MANHERADQMPRFLGNKGASNRECATFGQIAVLYAYGVNIGRFQSFPSVLSKNFTAVSSIFLCTFGLLSAFHLLSPLIQPGGYWPASVLHNAAGHIRTRFVRGYPTVWVSMVSVRVLMLLVSV